MTGVQGFSFIKYYLLFLPVVGIEPATSKWFQSEAPFNQTSYPQRHVPWPENSIFETFKPNVYIFKQNSNSLPLWFK